MYVSERSTAKHLWWMMELFCEKCKRFLALKCFHKKILHHNIWLGSKYTFVVSNKLVNQILGYSRSSRPEELLGKGALKTCSQFTGEHACRSVIPIRLQSNFIEITLWHMDFSCKFATFFPNNTSGRLLLILCLIMII